MTTFARHRKDGPALTPDTYPAGFAYKPRHRSDDTTMPCGCVMSARTGQIRTPCGDHRYLTTWKAPRP